MATTELVAEASAFDLTANILARLAADRPEELAELAMIVDARHYPLFRDVIAKNKAAVVPLLNAELGKSALPGWAGAGEIGLPVAAVVGAAPLADVLNADAMIDALAKRKGNAAATLVALGEESVWPLFAFPKDGDPSTRSYLLARLAAIGADPLTLIRRFEAEADVSAKRALLITLGDYPPDSVLPAEWVPFVSRLLGLYRNHPDPGLHGAIDWLLRQKWGNAKEVAAIDAELTSAARARVVARAVADAISPLPFGSLIPAPPVAVGKEWFVNAEGQTFAVVRGPVEFTIGSPVTEPGRLAGNEPAHRKRIGRTFAVATKEVTVAEYLRFRPRHWWLQQYSPGPDTPAVSTSWYDCAEYCNWLSEREGIPKNQWCYEPNKNGFYGDGMTIKTGHLALTGYRLPTETEWEYMCRSGSVGSRSYGRGGELLPRYGWFLKHSDDRAWPVGVLRPNELGLFDMLGNATEWVEDPAMLYLTWLVDDKENSKALVLDDRKSRFLRGGSFGDHPVDLRSANRNNSDVPGNRNSSIGFRPARTLPTP